MRNVQNVAADRRLVMRTRKRRDYLTVVISGTFDLNTANQLTPKILEACASYRITKLLIDARGVDGTLSLADRFDYSATFARKYKERRVAGGFKHVQIAVVGSSAIMHNQKFGEKVARARGLDVKVSFDIREALAWLGVSA
jgi:hypothetical protein